MLRKRMDGRYGYVELDNPPVNAIGQAMRQALIDAVEWAEMERLERVILSGGTKVFAAGADTREFDRAPEPPHLPEVVNRIESSPVHWIAAISGAALGGGAEIALACRYRIARPDASVGFPEVILGVVPGAGGTQRLPRLVGLENALELVSTGRPVSGAKAAEIRLVDELSDDPVLHAEMLNSEWLDMAVPVGELNSGELDADVFEAARETAAKKMRGQAAPQRAIDLVELCQTATLADGMEAERATFLDLRASAQSRAMRHLFFAEREATRVPNDLGAPADMEMVAVVGGGTMGASIAYALLSAGLSVTLLEADEGAVDRAGANLERLFKADEERGMTTRYKSADLRQHLAFSTDYDSAAEADLVIEAAFESMEVKAEVFAKLQKVTNAGVPLATNTSYLDVNALAATLDDPSRVLGLHFFAPAHIMKLLEIVRGKATSPAALATGFALARRLHKIPVVAGVCDGFIGNRILARYREAADTLLMDGTTPWELDEAMVEFGYAMGPYEAQDLSGLDIAFANRRRQDATRDPRRRYIPISDRMVNEGRLGRKASVGWYRYPGGGGKVVDPLIEDLVREEAYFAKVERRDYSADDIRRRLLLAMINEAADILREGVAKTASDIDLVTVHGYGFPRWRGGLMHYADTLGVKSIRDQLRDLADEDPVAWTPSPLIERLADRGRGFADPA